MSVQPLNSDDYNGLDPGIRRVVRWLREQGYETTDSGDGVSKHAEARVFDVPHVVILVEPDEMVDVADELYFLLCSAIDEPFYTSEGLSWDIEASYSAVDKTAVIIVTGVSDSLLEGE